MQRSMDRVEITRTDGPEILFSHAELACKATGAVKLAPGFAHKLAMLRMTFGKPMIVTSCCRSAEHNRRVGGHPRSLHVYDEPHWPTGGTCAIDIRVPNGTYAGELAFLAWQQGWSYGVPKGGFIHLDRRDIVGLPQAVFGY